MANVEEVWRRLSSAVHGSGEKVLVSAPGRVDFLNTHQDYKVLPVVPVAIGLRSYAMGTTNGSDVVRVASLNLAKSGEDYQDEFQLHDLRLRGHGWFGDYFRAVFESLRGRGHNIEGMDIAIWSEVPIGAGLSSSAALEVSVARLCSACLGYRMPAGECAEVAYGAEHDIMGIPCGRLDQYSAAFGGVMRLSTRPPYRVEVLDWPQLTLVIADSGEHRRTSSVHPIRQREIDEALAILMDEAGIPRALKSKLGYHCSDPSWENITEAEISPFLPSLGKRLANRLLFTVRMQLSTSYALAILRRPSRPPPVPPALALVMEALPDDALSALGAVIDYQHELLRDLYEVSTARLEKARGVLKDAGALGAKISGAGMGGAIVGLVGNQEEGQRLKKTCESEINELWVSVPAPETRVETLR